MNKTNIKTNVFGNKIAFTLSEAIKFYRKYRYNREKLLDEKRYIMEAFWEHCEREKEKAMRYRDWLFEYYFSAFEKEA